MEASETESLCSGVGGTQELGTRAGRGVGDGRRYT